MIMKKTKTIALLMVTAFTMSAAAKDFTVTSPNGKLFIKIHANQQKLTWEVNHGTTQVLAPSEIGLNGTLQKMDGKVTKNTAMISNRQYRVEFRADNDAAAYRIHIIGKRPITIDSETAEFNFLADYPAFIPYINDNRSGERYSFSFESYYNEQPLSAMFKDSLAINPLAVRLPQNKLAVIADMGAVDYPGMFLLRNGEHGLKACFAPVPTREEISGYARLNLVPTARASYIAKDVKGSLPWRIVMVTEQDKDLLSARLPQRFGPSCQLKDTSWIRPGKVAWDWWNDWNIGGVDFRAGINTETYKYYIDFASQKGIEYVILDEGWAVNLKADLLQIIPEIDLKGIVEYGKQKGVGIILWAGYYAFNRDMENVCKHYSDMGVKGFKIDFMDRDDQLMTEFMYRAAATCAKYHMLADFHGTYKPSGLNRTYPNVVNFEGVHGLEQMKWESGTDQLKYDVTIPYIRQVAGPMDYTQGAMLNGGIRNYHPFNSEPMSQGTRCHQLGLYVVLDSPLNMLCDSPTNYLKEPECTDFIAKIPTVWDETRIIDGKVGEYIVTARRSGNTWYVGGITNREPRAESKLQIHLAPGGGFAAKIQ